LNSASLLNLQSNLMKYFFTLVFLLFALLNTGNAQTESLIDFVPDRPGMATPTNTMPKGRLQVENGFQMEKLTIFNNTDEVYISSLLFRYGIIENTELRIQTDYVYNKTNDSTITSIIHGFNPITIGSKIKIIQQQKIIPSISVLFNLTLPVVGKSEFVPKDFVPSFLLLMSNDITDILNISYNYGMLWNGDSSEPTHFYALCFETTFTTKWSSFVEGYGFSNKHTNTKLYIDAGLGYLISKRIQIDFSVMGYLNSIRDYNGLNAGIAWQI